MIACFLGTSSGVPTASRNVSGLVLELSGGREIVLFDCGEGTQHQFRRAGFKVRKIARVCITHMHADHVLGLPGFVSSLAMAGRTEPLDIHGPAKLEPFLRGIFALCATTLPFPLRFHVATPGETFDAGRFVLRCAPLEHRIPAMAWRVDETPRRGESRSFVFATDSRPCEGTVALARGADLLVHEATYANAHAVLAAERGHSTAEEAAMVASKAGVGRLVLTHFSPRYGKTTPVPLETLLFEARAIFPCTDLASDFLRVDVAREATDPSAGALRDEPTEGG